MFSTITRALALAGFAGALLAGSSQANRQAATSSQVPAVKRETLAKPIYVAGLQVRTNNAREASGNGEIGKLWGRFSQQSLGAQIPGRLGQTLIVVYSDYASDEKGDYNYLLGAPVSSVDALPPGLVYRRIPPGDYAVVTTEKGDTMRVVPTAWRRIWSMTPQQLGGRRAFTEDYEIYDRRSADPRNAEVEIHLSLRAN